MEYKDPIQLLTEYRLKSRFLKNKEMFTNKDYIKRDREYLIAIDLLVREYLKEARKTLNGRKLLR